METSTVTRKGQITIPARLRRRLQIREGTKVAFEAEGDHIVIRPLESDVAAAFGLVRATRSVSDKEMERAIRRKAGR